MALIPVSCTAAERCGVGLFENEGLANSYAMKNIADLSSVMKVLWRGEKPIANFISENYNSMRNCKLGRDVCLSIKDNVGG